MFNRKELIDYCHKVYSKGFVSAVDGNLSARCSHNTFLITRSAVCKGDVSFGDLLEIDKNGKIISGKGKISTEYKIHLLAYEKRKDVNAVVHCHPPFSTAFAISEQTLNKPILPEVILSLGKIPLCKYGTPSTDELPNSILDYIEFANVFLLENHGALTFGKSIKEAFYRMEKLEQYAQIIFYSRLIGGEKELNKNSLEKLYSAAEKNYGIKLHPLNKF